MCRLNVSMFAFREAAIAVREIVGTFFSINVSASFLITMQYFPKKSVLIKLLFLYNGQKAEIIRGKKLSDKCKEQDRIFEAFFFDICISSA